MRLIEEQMCSAVINKNDWRKDNTEVMYSPSRDVCCVYLHGNLIATIDKYQVEIKVYISTSLSGLSMTTVMHTNAM